MLFRELIDKSPKFLFFTGKGGVGKTSMACAVSVALSDMGRNVLLVSTDPASNLDEVLETSLANIPKGVKHINNLMAMNIDPNKAAHDYKEKMIGPFRGVLPEDTIVSMEEQLSGACTMEVATFNEFSRLIGDENISNAYDHIILDTAPTGHTLRLLSLPAAWDNFILENQTGSTCIGSLSQIEGQKKYYENARNILTDPNYTILVLVTRADEMSFKEAERAGMELYEQGIKYQHLIINGIFKSASSDSLALDFAKKTDKTMKNMPYFLNKLPKTLVSFMPFGIIGAEALRNAALEKSEQPSISIISDDEKLKVLNASFSWDKLLSEIEARGSGVVMTMGKGGVGKTSIAAAIACELAFRGHSVHLSTTDPAEHLSQTLNSEVKNLKVSRINPKEETQKYVVSVMEVNSQILDEEGIELLKEEMKSPCIEEIAVFNAFAKMVSNGKSEFTVLDTAPTGHTLLLLDATESYHKQVAKNSDGVSDEVKNLLPLLKNPDFTKILIVTLPEATPVHEAEQLQSDLRRAGIEPYAWVINQSFAATDTKDTLLKQKSFSELKYIKEVTQRLSKKTVLSPWLGANLKGHENLRKIFT
ncbi:MAG TPA: arsenical pump-driving ATPase [Lentisphaeria bacterium]|nr:MAG: arsenical pump-driving ATPase [Lentisphaerae bacterium GWF2_38_69]HBM15295.1 arsenical pump-driving ATPase [Lentisphaeria bacterium]